MLYGKLPHMFGKGVKHASPSAKGFCGIFFGITHYKKGYLFYVPHKREIASLYNIVFGDSFCSALVFMSQPYAEAMDLRPAVSYIPYAISSWEQNGDIITFRKFEEGDLISDTRNNTESGNKSDGKSTIAPFVIESEIDVMSSGYESDAEPISTYMLEDIRDGSQSHPIINRREACYKIQYHIK